MYIDKLQPFWTDAELQETESCRQQNEELQEQMREYPLLSEEWINLNAKQEELRKKEREIYESVRKRYTLSFYRRPHKVFDDVREIVEATTQEEFLGYLEAGRQFDLYADPNGNDPAIRNFLEDFYTESYENFAQFIRKRLGLQNHVINYYGLPQEKFTAIIEKHVGRFYKQAQPPFKPLLQAPATNALAESSPKAFITDPITGAQTQTVNGITITAAKGANVRQLSQSLKLADLLVLKLGAAVPYHATPEEIMRSRELDFSVTDYMESRDLSDAKHARAQLIEGLQLLYNLSLDWQEVVYYDFETGTKLKKPERKKWHARILDAIGEDFDKPIKRGNATIRFNPDLVAYLSYGYIAPMPTFLFKINDRHYPYAYLMGRKMALHKNMNIGKADENRIGVATLLEIMADLPTYEEVVNSKDRHVKARIIEPFERNLSGLELGMKWHYLNSRGERITQKQLDNFTYADWITWLVEFEFTDYPDTTERLEEITEIREIKKKNKTKEKAKRKAKRG